MMRRGGSASLRLADPSSRQLDSIQLGSRQVGPARVGTAQTTRGPARHLNKVDGHEK